MKRPKLNTLEEIEKDIIFYEDNMDTSGSREAHREYELLEYIEFLENEVKALKLQIKES